VNNGTRDKENSLHSK